LRDVETDLDRIPILNSFAKGMARSQAQASVPAATQEVKQKIAGEARQRIEAETQQQLNDVVKRLNSEVFDPLNSLALDPQMIEGDTDNKRFRMRLRLAGEDQLGSHTPRPPAPDDSLASIQIHESVINNCIQRLELDGRTFTMAELAKHIASRLNRTTVAEISPENENATITFAAKDAVVVRFRDNRVDVTVSVALLARLPQQWKNFQVHAFYQPEIRGRSAELRRDGVLEFSKGANWALRGIFHKPFSDKTPWQLMPERILKEPKLKDTSITQFVIDDGWIGVSLGPKRPAARVANRLR
jgi:hypothetical protein